jgi:hypothetical protein
LDHNSVVRNHRETPVSCDKSSLRQASSRLDGKEVGRNLVLQATRVHAVHTASATHPRAFHSSDSPPQRDGSSCPSRARKRAPKSMPASPAGHASEDEKTVFRDVRLEVIVHYSQAIQLRDKLQNVASSNRTFSRSRINHLFF